MTYRRQHYGSLLLATFPSAGEAVSTAAEQWTWRSGTSSLIDVYIRGPVAVLAVRISNTSSKPPFTMAASTDLDGFLHRGLQSVDGYKVYKGHTHPRIRKPSLYTLEILRGWTIES